MNALDPITWSILLMLAACVLAVSEVFIPSGGILGFLSAVAVLASISLAFYHYGPAAGFAFALVAVVALPAIIALGLKYWPQTALGRQFVPELPSEDDVTPDDPLHRELKALVGKTGVARTPLLPSGAIRIDGRSYDAVSQGQAIEPGQAVKVVEVAACRIMVRLVEEGDEPPTRAEDDVLSQPIDQLGIDPIDDPLG